MMNRTEYKEKIQELIKMAHKELSKEDMRILASMVFAESLSYLKGKDVWKTEL